MPRLTLTEATTSVVAAPVEGAPGRFLIQLIDGGWGSSGYYPADVLEAAGKARIFPAGTHMYLDHPTESEKWERPERSVRDLAAVLNEDARYDQGSNALVAEATVFGTYREALEQMAESIGVSIRALADGAPGTVEGRTGTVFSELVEGLSADFVTHAGRGGKILQVIESARTSEEQAGAADTERLHAEALKALSESRNVGQWIESRLHFELTRIGDDMYGNGYLTREERIALSGAVGDALDAFTESLTESAPQLYQRDLWDDPAVIAAQVDESATTHVPAARSDEPSHQEEHMPEIAESELRTLREAAGRVQTLESERDAAVQRAETAESERDEAREANARHDREATIARILGEAVEAGTVEPNDLERAGIAARAVVKDGTVDEAATRTAFDTALATLAEADGAGRPRGLGRTTKSTEDEDTVSEADLDALGDSIFGEIKEA